jgi:hypothetical protein
MPTSPSSENLRQKLNMKKYLNELAALVGRSVHADELGRPAEAAEIREASQKFIAQDAQAFEILFSERRSDRFKEFVLRLHDANPSSVYIWMPHTIVCGALLVPSLISVKFDFEFAINDDGILTFLTSDSEDRLLLDFSSSPVEDQLMKVETQGPNWTRVIY